MCSFMIICYTCTEYDCYDLINKFHCIITYKTKKTCSFLNDERYRLWCSG